MHYKACVLNSFQWQLDVSLQDDFQSIVYQRLKSQGYDVNKEKAIYQYYNLEKRLVSSKPRKVFYSKEFRCPEEYEKALKEFDEKAKLGADLTPFMSSKRHNTDYNDLLLNDWGIQHFHLSRRFNDDGSVKASDYEIFARVTDKTIYMIQIYRHNADDLYCKQEMVRILRDNWPEVTEKFHLGELTGLTEKVDDHQYSMLRKKNILSLVELGSNEVYGPVGGGYASNGFSLEALHQGDYLLNFLGKVELFLVKEAEWIGKVINQMNLLDKAGCRMEIKLFRFESTEKIILFEIFSGVFIYIDLKKDEIQFQHWYGMDKNRF